MTVGNNLKTEIMKKIITWCGLLIIAASILGACSPEEYSLGEVDVTPTDLVEGTAFKIERDASNPNIINLVSLMGMQYTPLWEHPQGRSQKQSLSLRIPFSGTYTVKFGVETRGGVVYSEPVAFTVDEFYPGFIDNELWTLLSGGVDQEKTWFLDLDATGTSRHFAGPLFFYGTDDSWETVTEGKTVDGDVWNWSPDYPGNSWIMNAGDYGTMVFSLKDGANVTVSHTQVSGRDVEKGTYMLDTDNYTMRMNGAAPLHDQGRDEQVIDWGNIKIMSLTENTMQLGILRDDALSGEGAALMVYNYITRDYYESLVAGD